MALTVEEIEAILRLRDEMSGPAKTAAGNVKQAFGSISALGAGLTAGVTLPIAAIGGASIKMAMDAVESENLFEVSYGRMAEAARNWSQETSAALGLNEYEIRRTSATLYTMMDSMGLTEEQSYEMATGLTQLAADMASFYNISTEMAFEKLRAGIVGEAEPLKALGILVDETTSKTYAYSAGIAEQGEKLDQQQKVLARYTAIMAQTSKAQGDLGRTLESPTNQMRIAGEQMKQMSIDLGMALMPVATDFIGMMRSEFIPMMRQAVDWFEQASPAVQKTVTVIAGLAAAAGPALMAVGSIGRGVFFVVEAAQAVAGPMSKFVGFLSGSGTAAGVAGRALSLFTGPVGWIIGTAATVLTLTGTWDEFWRILKAGASIAIDVLKVLGSAVLWVVDQFTYWTGIQAIVKDLWELLKMFGGWFADFMGMFATGMEWAADAVGMLTGASDDLADSLPKVESPFKDLNETIDFSADAHEKLAKAMKEESKAAEASKEAAAKSREEHEKYRKEVQELADVLTGRNLIPQMNKLVDAIEAAGGKAKITAYQWKELQRQARDLGAQGAELPPILHDAYVESTALEIASRGLSGQLQMVRDAIRGVNNEVELFDPYAWQTGLIKPLGESLAIIEQTVPKIKELTPPPPDPWRKYKDDVTRIVGDIRDGVVGEFAQMALGAVSWKEGMIGIWETLKAGALRIFNEILKGFITGLLGQMSNALGNWVGSALGMFSQVSNAGMGAASGAGVGVGGSTIGLGAVGAGVGLGVGAVGAGAALGWMGYEFTSAFFGDHFTSPEAQALLDAQEFVDNASYMGMSAAEALSNGFGEYLSQDALDALYSGAVPGLATGGFVRKTGLAVVHKGETFLGDRNQALEQVTANTDEKDRPLYLTVPVYFGNEFLGEKTIETTIRAIETNNGGGAQLGPNTRLRIAFGLPT